MIHKAKIYSVGRDNWRDLSIEVGISAITLPQFTMIRKVLEECEDFIVLADVSIPLYYSGKPVSSTLF